MATTAFVLPELFRKDKNGKTRVWSARVDHDPKEDLCFLVTVSGFTNGKKVTHKKPIKEEGDKLRRTLALARSRWKHMIRNRGYEERGEGKFKLMRMRDCPLSFPPGSQEWCVQPLIEGVECSAALREDGGRVVLVNAEGEHLRDHKGLEDWLPKNMHLHGVLQEDHFFVSDCFHEHRPDEPFSDRWRWLSENFERSDFASLVTTRRCDDLRGLHLQHVHQYGHPGTVLKKLDSLYEPGKESRGYLRYKGMLTEDFAVVDWKIMSGGGEPWFQCRTREKRLFWVPAPGEPEQRRALLKRAPDLVRKGVSMTVRFLGYRSGDITPVSPVAIRLRE